MDRDLGFLLDWASIFSRFHHCFGRRRISDDVGMHLLLLFLTGMDFFCYKRGLGRIWGVGFLEKIKRNQAEGIQKGPNTFVLMG